MICVKSKYIFEVEDTVANQIGCHKQSFDEQILGAQHILHPCQGVTNSWQTCCLPPLGREGEGTRPHGGTDV